MMTKLDQFVQNYLQNLEGHLNELPSVERKNQVEEVKGHLISFVEDYQTKGLSESEIERKIQEEFLSPEEVAQQLLDTKKENTKSKNYINKNTVIIAAFLALFLSFALPTDYKILPLVVLLFALAYFIFTKKLLWGFALVRKNPGKVKNRDKIARLGGIYVFLVALVILLGEFIEMFRSDMTLWIVILGYVAYMSYVRKNTVD